MISFLSNWIEQITISVIIVSVFELILPKGNLKKYIKVVLGVYIIFCFISPFVNSANLYNVNDIDLEKVAENLTKDASKNTGQQSMDNRLQKLYVEELKKNISKKVAEDGYEVSKCTIDASLNEDEGINKISLSLKKKGIASVEKVEIMQDSGKEESSDDIEKIKEELATFYQIDKEKIDIKIK